MSLYQIKKLLHSRGNNYQSAETACRMGEGSAGNPACSKIKLRPNRL
jgi:hypothetical protein